MATRFPTRVLLSAAALGAAGGVYVVALNWASVLTGAIAYYAYAATIALWALPVFVAQALLRRPGIALLTSVIMGLINAAFTPFGVQQLMNFVVVGIVMELPFAVTLYRRWSKRFFWVAHPVSALLQSAIYTVSVILAFEAVPWWALAIAIVGGVISSFVVTWLGQLIAGRLRKAGLGGREVVTSATA
jgi:energy-coupling factor transport system substrate-specific component